MIKFSNEFSIFRFEKTRPGAKLAAKRQARRRKFTESGKARQTGLTKRQADFPDFSQQAAAAAAGVVVITTGC